MPVKAVKQAIEPITPPDIAPPNFDFESMIADEILDNLDWAKVRSALLKKAPARLFAWFVSGDNTPINISQFPELSALPSANEGEAA